MSNENIEIKFWAGTIEEIRKERKRNYSSNPVVSVVVSHFVSTEHEKTFITNYAIRGKFQQPPQDKFKVGDEVSIRYKIDHYSVRKESEIIGIVHGLDEPVDEKGFTESPDQLCCRLA